MSYALKSHNALDFDTIITSVIQSQMKMHASHYIEEPKRDGKPEKSSNNSLFIYNVGYLRLGKKNCISRIHPKTVLLSRLP